MGTVTADRSAPAPRPDRSLRSFAALALGLGLALAVTAPAIGQGVTEPDPLTASLLQAEDLPVGFSSQGPEDGSVFDIDSGSFSRFGGRRVVSQAWAHPVSGVVFDFRMELPTPEAAAAYLEAAEATLSEADVTGLSLVEDDAPVGEHARHYTGVTRIDADRAITFDNHLFHVGPVAAKVYVASVDLPAGEARRIAEAAASRMAGFAVPEAGSVSPPVDAHPADTVDVPPDARGTPLPGSVRRGGSGHVLR